MPLAAQRTLCFSLRWQIFSLRVFCYVNLPLSHLEVGFQFSLLYLSVYVVCSLIEPLFALLSHVRLSAHFLFTITVPFCLILHYLGASSTSPVMRVPHSSRGSLPLLQVFCSVHWPELKIYAVLYVFSHLLFFFLFLCHGCIFLFDFEVHSSGIPLHTQECCKGSLACLIFSFIVNVHKFLRFSHLPWFQSFVSCIHFQKHERIYHCTLNLISVAGSLDSCLLTL